MSQDPQVVTATVADGVRVVRLSGEVDLDSTAPVTRALDLADDGGRKGTVVDLTALAFADSSLLHRLLDARRAPGAAGVPLVLVRPGRAVERLLRVTGTYGFFTTADTVEAALATMGTTHRM
jgi:anti-anti-sigma factor